MVIWNDKSQQLRLAGEKAVWLWLWHFLETGCSNHLPTFLPSFLAPSLSPFSSKLPIYLFGMVELKHEWTRFPSTLWFPAFYGNHCVNKMAAAGQIDLVVRYFGLDGLWLACSAQPSGSRTVSHSDTWEWAREADMLPLSCSHHNVESWLSPPRVYPSALA